eukprot:Hpha_TRINITY_DN19476_c0_g1::TRINITY_DN19476_c0_g1_i1::g.45763::m.45763
MGTGVAPEQGPWTRDRAEGEGTVTATARSVHGGNPPDPAPGEHRPLLGAYATRADHASALPAHCTASFSYAIEQLTPGAAAVVLPLVALLRLTCGLLGLTSRLLPAPCALGGSMSELCKVTILALLLRRRDDAAPDPGYGNGGGAVGCATAPRG